MSYRKKLQVLESARKTLKFEFVGIDKQIDQLVNSVKSWYLFPHLRKRPTIVNLWGITGTFKTSLVRRLVILLDLSNEFREQDARKVKSEGFITACLGMNHIYDSRVRADVQPKVFLIDEIQNAKTLDIEGEDAKNAENLSDFFSILSDGKIVVKRDEYVINGIRSTKADLDDEEKLIKSLKKRLRTRLSNVSKEYDEYIEKLTQKQASMSEEENASVFNEKIENVIAEKEEELNDLTILSVFWEAYGSNLNRIGISEPDFQEYLTIEDAISGIKEILKNTSMDIVHDFSNALIFNLGNLDGIFGRLTYTLDTEFLSPDEFYELTKTVSFNDAKRCLLSLFRPEQVSRLGSNHIIFPSFNSEMYFNLIKKFNKSLIDDAKKENIKIKIDKSLDKLVFNLGAVPSQGARAIISTHETLVKLPVSEAITLCILGKHKSATLSVDKDSNILVKYGKKSKVLDNMLINRHKEASRVISNERTMVHEAGHAIVATAVMGMYPTKISVIEEQGHLGYVLPNKEYKPEIINRQFFIDKIAISMAGRVAEEMKYGKDEGSNAGASSDIENATRFATLAVKVFGLGDSHDTRSGFAGMFNHPDSMIAHHKEADDMDAEEMVKEGTALAFVILNTLKKHHTKLVSALKKRPELNEDELRKVLKM